MTRSEKRNRRRYKLERQVIKALGSKFFPPRRVKDSDRQGYLKRVLVAVHKLDKEQWTGLPDELQEWSNLAIQCANRNESIPDFDTDRKPELFPGTTHV
jgi:hypothetical protein